MGVRTEKDGWSTRVALRYTLLQLPGWALLILILLLIDRRIDIPAWIMALVVALWIGKDVVMFPFVWRAYDQAPSRIMYRMVGERAVAKENLSPHGYVQLHGELWQAEVMPGAAPVEKGRKVRVRDVRGLTLLVQLDQNDVQSE
jgi:membrane protein implicated in regulation of membrane protease activity